MLSVFRTRWWRCLIIVALGALASGCSTLRIGYATAPDLVYWRLDSYLDFNSAQAVRVHEAIRQWFAWHRATQLPDYADQLARARVEVLGEATPARVCEWQALLVQRARAAFDRIAPAAADIMTTITPAQVQHLEQRYAKFDEQFRDDYLQPDAQARARKSVDRVVDRVEMLYGRLDDKQRDLIVQAVARSPFDPEVWLAERRQRQQDMLQILRRVGSTGATREQALAELNTYAQNYEHSPRPAYARYADRLSEFNCAFAAEFHNTTSAAQRRHAAEQLGGWEEDLRIIAGHDASADRRPEP